MYMLQSYKTLLIFLHTIGDCVWAAWGQWSTCSTGCDDGKADVQVRQRDIVSEGMYGGDMCNLADMAEERPCTVAEESCCNVIVNRCDTCRPTCLNMAYPGKFDFFSLIFEFIKTQI